MGVNAIREIWNDLVRDLNQVLKYSARISEAKTIQEKTFFIIQLIGKNTCSPWISALELVKNKQLFDVLSPKEQEYVNFTCRMEYNSSIGCKKAMFFISAIDFEPECIISIASMDGLFQIKLPPDELFLNKRIFNNINRENQKSVKFYVGLGLGNPPKPQPRNLSNIIPFQKI